MTTKNEDTLSEIQIRISRLPSDEKIEDRIEQLLLYLAKDTGIEYTMWRRAWWGTSYNVRSYQQPLTWLERAVYWSVLAVGVCSVLAAIYVVFSIIQVRYV